MCQVDLNRDFPDPFERGEAGIVEPGGREQPETLALMQWIRSRHFVASASLHEVGRPSCIFGGFVHMEIIYFNRICISWRTMKEDAIWQAKHIECLIPGAWNSCTAKLFGFATTKRTDLGARDSVQLTQTSQAFCVACKIPGTPMSVLDPHLK